MIPVITTLIFMHCASADSASCEIARVAWDGSPLQCSLFAQQGIANWLRENPGRVLRGRHKCVTEPAGGGKIA